MHASFRLLGTMGLLLATPGIAQVRPEVIASDGDSNLAQNPFIKGRPSTFDIGGIKLGMTPAEVLRVASAKGMRVKWHATGARSFEEEVSLEMSRLQGKSSDFKLPAHTSGLGLSDDTGSIWDIDFYTTPTGQRVSKILYTSPMAGRTMEIIRANITQKYGLSTLSSSVTAADHISLIWCEYNKGDRCNNWGSETTLTAFATNRELRLDLGLDSPTRNAAAQLVKSTAKSRLAAVPTRDTF